VTRQARAAVKPPGIRYARNGEIRIAYQVVGHGPLDLVFVPGLVSNLELHWEDPGYHRLMQRLSTFTRLIMLDKRGTGLSDRVDAHALPSLETRMDDVRAVMDVAGSGRAALLGASEGAPMSILFAATYPERTRALVLYGGYAHFTPSCLAARASRSSCARTCRRHAFRDLVPRYEPAGRIADGRGRARAHERSDRRIVSEEARAACDGAYFGACGGERNPGLRCRERSDSRLRPAFRGARSAAIERPHEPLRLLAVVSEQHLEPAARATSTPSSPAPGLGALSAREREVLALVADGLSNAAIAKSLRLSGQRHVANILLKLDLPTRAAAAALAARQGQ